MSDNDNLDLDNQLAKSIEKLVDEETSVAKAFVDRNVIKNGDDFKTYRPERGSAGTSSIDSKTQAIPDIPSRKISLDDGKQEARYNRHRDQYSDRNSNTDSEKNNNGIHSEYNENSNIRHEKSDSIYDKTSHEQNLYDFEEPDDNTNDGNRAKPPHKKGMNQKNKLIIVAAVSVAILAVIIIIVVSMMSGSNKKNSYSYNISKGIEYYNDKQYTEALPYLSKAASTDSGKKDIELKFKLYECYLVTNDTDKAVDMLKDILTYEKYNGKAITALSEFYAEKEDGDKMTELINKYRGTEGEQYILKYEVNAPTASLAGGTYNDTIELELNADAGNKIYYTSDGTAPTAKNNLYSDKIKIEKGETMIKAVSVNEIGTCSEVVELKYIVDFKAPSAPAINPVSGTYSAGQKIEIVSLKEGDKLYYTLDGSTPTSSSTEYTGGFDMPEGNTVVSAIIISQYGLESSVTKRNYNVPASKTYTFDEAVELLKARMKIKQDLNADGTSADGGVATFVYQKKVTIADVEMYYIRYDSKKSGVTSTVGYYGVGLKDGKCYRIVDSNGSYSATEY